MIQYKLNVAKSIDLKQIESYSDKVGYSYSWPCKNGNSKGLILEPRYVLCPLWKNSAEFLLDVL